MERLQKVLANANVASRRKSEELILEGRVSVNDIVVRELGIKVSTDDIIRVDGKLIKQEEKIYLLLNKPSGYLSTTSDDKDRRIVTDLLKDEFRNVRLYPIGRLDYDAKGLLLLTNDGDLTKKLTNPDVLIINEFIIRTKGVVLRRDIQKLRRGIKVKNRLIKPLNVELMEIDKENQSSLLILQMTESRNMVIKNMFREFGYPIKNLTRTKFGNLEVTGVKRGSYRSLKIHEVKKLYSI